MVRIEAGIRNLNIETAGIEEKAEEVLEAAIGMATQEMEVEEDRA